MNVGYAASLVICAAMLVLSALMYGIVMKQREDDRTHFLGLHRELVARVKALEAELEIEAAQLEVEGTETEAAVEPETQETSIVKPVPVPEPKTQQIPRVVVEPETQKINTVETSMAIELEWQQKQDEIYQQAMAEIERMSARGAS